MSHEKHEKHGTDRHHWMTVLWTRQEWAKLEAVARECLQDDPDDQALLRNITMAFLCQGKMAEAVAAIRRIFELAPESGPSHEMACRYWLADDEPGRAWYHASEWLRLDPANPYALLVAGHTLARQGKTKAALALGRHARHRAPDDPGVAESELLLRLGIQRTVDDHVQAQADLLDVLAADPARSTARELLGDIAMATVGDHRAAIDHYRAALAANPDDQDCQAKLVALISQQNILTQTLFLPIHAVRMWRRDRKEWLAFYGTMIIVSPPVIGITITWLVVTGVLFGVPAKAYELLFLADASLLSMRSRPIRTCMLALQQIPFGLRVMLLASLWCGFWVWVPVALGLDVVTSLLVIAGIFGVHVAGVALLHGAQRLNWWLARQRAGLTRRQRLIRWAKTMGYLWVAFPATIAAIVAVLHVWVGASPEVRVGIDMLVMGSIGAVALLTLAMLLILPRTLRASSGSRFESYGSLPRLPKAGRFPELPD